MTTATDYADAHSIAKSLLAEAGNAAPTALYAKAKIAALQIAADAGGSICPNIREIGQACQSMSGIVAHRAGRMLMNEVGENIFQLTAMGNLVVEYLPREDQSVNSPAGSV